MVIQAKSDIREKSYDGLLHLEISPKEKYIVVSVEGDFYRVLNDEKEPYLYPKEMFVVTDESIPGNWICLNDSDDVYYIGPKEFSVPGFFEDYFDGMEYAKMLFKKVCSDEMV